MEVNYFGAGGSNVEKPADYYQIIDDRKAIAKTRNGSDAGVQKFNSVLKEFKTKNIDKTKSIINKSSINNIKANHNVKAKPVAIIEQEIQKNTKPTLQSDSSELNKHGVPEKNGTNLALKKVSKEMETQLYSMFWTMIDEARDVEHEGGFAEKMFRGPYLMEVVKSSEDDKLGEIGEAIYRSLANENQNN